MVLLESLEERMRAPGRRKAVRISIPPLEVFVEETDSRHVPERMRLARAKPSGLLGTCKDFDQGTFCTNLSFQ